MSRTVLQYGQLFLVGLGMAIAQVLLKQGMRQAGGVPMNLRGLLRVIGSVLSSPTLMAGYAVGGITTLAWLILLSRIDLSYAAPIVTAIYFVLLLLMSRIALQEHVAAGRWAGAALAVAGIVLMSLKG